MAANLSNLKPARGSRHRKVRVGRGIGSKLGRTAGKGKARVIPQDCWITPNFFFISKARFSHCFFNFVALSAARALSTCSQRTSVSR